MLMRYCKDNSTTDITGAGQRILCFCTLLIIHHIQIIPNIIRTYSRELRYIVYHVNIFRTISFQKSMIFLISVLIKGLYETSV